jgi:hypothetical protein
MSKITIDETLKSLRASYEKGDISAYRDILISNKDLFSKGGFHYYLGAGYLKENNLPAAKYNLEKSLMLGHVTPETYNNLKYIRKNLSVEDVTESGSYHDQYLSEAMLVPTEYYLILSLLLFALFLTSIKLGKIAKRLKNWILIGLISALPLVAIVYLKTFHFAMVLGDAAIYEGPSAIYKQVTVAKAGAKFIVGQKSDDWYFIKAPTHIMGWIKKEDVALY